MDGTRESRSHELGDTVSERPPHEVFDSDEPATATSSISRGSAASLLSLIGGNPAYS